VSREAERLAWEIERLFGLVVKRRPEEAETEPQLTPTQRLALAVIVDEGPLRLGALADRMSTTDPTATRAVDALVAERLVERTPDPDDRRAIQVAATRGGRRLLERRRRRFVQLLRTPLSQMRAREQAELVELLAALNRALDQ
jgi:DNA-binding MarR family transcriptional regulator